MSAPVSLRLRTAATSAIDRVPSYGVRALAPPPPGSGLKPVMGDPGLPVVGHTLGFVGSMLDASRERYARYGTVSWANVIGTPLVIALGPDAIERILVNKDRAFASREGWNYFIGPFFDRGVMLMDFEEHRHHRRIMQEAFRREQLVRYVEAMNPAIERGIAAWEPREGFRLYDRTKQLTLDIATEVFVGGALGAEADRLNRAFVDAVHGGQAIVRRDVPGGRWHRGLLGRRVLEDWFREQLPARRASGGNDLFSVLCRAETEDGERFSDEDVVAHMIFTLMAAHDTSTITFAMAALQLARHPEWQERLREESRALGKATIGFDDLDALPAMDLVFKETLRSNSPVGLVAREARFDTEVDGHFVPAGSRIGLGLFPSMRMEPWWSDPDRFDPERFSPERREDAWHKYAFAPFGGTAHKCIGMHFGAMEVKAMLHQLLLRFSLDVPAGYEPLMDYGTGVFPADGLPLTLRRI
jgi:cytochrome P450